MSSKYYSKSTCSQVAGQSRSWIGNDLKILTKIDCLLGQHTYSKLDSMKSLKLSFDLSDEPELVELLRMESAHRKLSRKEILVNALKAYFADKVEGEMHLRIAGKTFSEWNSEADKAYDNL